jgi:hypothetical protein
MRSAWEMLQLGCGAVSLFLENRSRMLRKRTGAGRSSHGRAVAQRERQDYGLRRDTAQATA